MYAKYRMALGCLLIATLAGCSSPAHNEFITIVQQGKNAEIGPGLKLIEMYRASYKITEEDSDEVPFTAIVTVEPKTVGATWKLVYEYRGNQWKFLRDKSRKFVGGSTEGIELPDDDIVWKKFATKNV